MMNGESSFIVPIFIVSGLPRPLRLFCSQTSSRRRAVSGFIGDVILDNAHEGVHPLGAFGQRGLQPLAVSVAALCVLLQPIQALISVLGKKPSAFREFLDQRFEVREVTSESS